MTNLASPVPAAETQSAQTMLLATFFVRDALCALDAASVQEVIRVGALTPVRHAPPEVVGIFNLRGRIATILDLGLRLGFSKAEMLPDSRIFIVEDRGEFLGLLVDRVDDVVEVERGDWQPPPSNTNRDQARFFKGVCRNGGRVITLLDAPQLLAEEGL